MVTTEVKALDRRREGVSGMGNSSGVAVDDQKRQGRRTEFTEVKVFNSSESHGSSIYSTLSGEP